MFNKTSLGIILLILCLSVGPFLVLNSSDDVEETDTLETRVEELEEQLYMSNDANSKMALQIEMIEAELIKANDQLEKMESGEK